MEKLAEKKELFVYDEDMFVEYMLDEDIETLSNFLDFNLIENPRTIDADDIKERANELSDEELKKWWTLVVEGNKVECSSDNTLKDSIKQLLTESISDDYVNDILDALSSDIIEDVKTTSDYEGQGYNTDDIRLAIGRVLINKLGLEK